MKRYPVFLSWLVVAALVDWLITRTLARSAIFMPKSPPVILIYQGFGLLGQLAATVTGLLVLAFLVWITWRGLRMGGEVVLPLAVASLVALSLVFLVFPPSGWMAIGYHLILIAVIVMIGWRAFSQADSISKKTAIFLVTLTLLVSELYQTIPSLYQAWQLPDPPFVSLILFNTGEGLLLLSSIALWWAHGRPAAWRVWLATSLPALAFIAMRLANPAMTGIIAIWSTGLTLYLPWPAYALSLWLAGVTVLASLKRGDPAGWAILLLAAGGYAPQLSTHAFLGIVALWLFLPIEEEATLVHKSQVYQVSELEGQATAKAKDTSGETSRWKRYIPDVAIYFMLNFGHKMGNSASWSAHPARRRGRIA